jgi:hypothetical protein
MKRIIWILISCFLSANLSAQNVNEVLGNGIVVKKGEKIFFQLSGGTVWYNVNNTIPTSIDQYTDSSLFLVQKTGVHVLLPPLNPLRFSYDTATAVIADPIMDDADKAFSSISSMITSVTTGRPIPGATQLPKKDSTVKTICDCPKCEDLSGIVSQVNTVVRGLENDLKDRINSTFTKLRNLPFEIQQPTRSGINEAKDSIDIYKQSYTTLEGQINTLQSQINSFKCQRDDSLIVKYVLVQILKEVKSTFNTKKSRLTNLVRAYTACDEVAKRVEVTRVPGHTWFETPIYVTVQDKKISILTVIVNYSGMEINPEDNEIVSTQKKTNFKKVLRLRKFQRFVPEASAGIAYTHLKYPKYGVTTDGSGQQIVEDAGEEEFKKLNVTAMINFVYFIENFNVNPLFQIGVGSNADYPVLFAGAGIRLNLSGVRRLTLTVGGASSWIKTLSKLKVGSPVTGTADLEKDYQFEYKKPQIYFGIQYNF